MYPCWEKDKHNVSKTLFGKCFFTPHLLMKYVAPKSLLFKSCSKKCCAFFISEMDGNQYNVYDLLFQIFG